MNVSRAIPSNRILSDPTPISPSLYAVLLDSGPLVDDVGDNGSEDDADCHGQRHAYEANSCLRACVNMEGLIASSTSSVDVACSRADVADYTPDHIPTSIDYGSCNDDFVDGVVNWSSPSMGDAGSATPASLPALGGGPQCRPAYGGEVRGADGIPSDGKCFAIKPLCFQRSCRDARGAGTYVSVPASRSRKRRDRAKRARLSLRELAGTSMGASLGHGSVRDPSTASPRGLSSESGWRSSGPSWSSRLSFAEQGCPRLPRTLCIDVYAVLVVACFMLLVGRRFLNIVSRTLFPTILSYVYQSLLILSLIHI